MKFKKARIVIEPIEKTKSRWVAALKGKSVRKKSSEELITLASFEVLGKLFSAPRLRILALIPVLKPKSISSLAKALRRDFKNTYSDVRFLADVGLIDLHETGTRRTLVPTAKFQGIEFLLAA